MSLQMHGDGDGDRHRQETLATNGSIASSVKKRKGPPCSQDGHGDSQAAKILGYSTPYLPEDIWHHIHSLLPLRDAARAACLSRAFLCSWRCFPNLIFDDSSLIRIQYCDFSRTIDNILRNHSGIGAKKLKIALPCIANSDIDRWLQVAATPGIEELTFIECRLSSWSSWRLKTKYNFPSSVLSDGVRNSVQLLQLGFCDFHSTTQLGTFRSLTTLRLFHVSIKEKELKGILSNTPVLEHLDLAHCDKIILLKLPRVLKRLIRLEVLACSSKRRVTENLKNVAACCRLRVIKNQAPNLSSLYISRSKVTGETSRVKNLTVHHSRGVYYARAELPSNMPNLETLDITSGVEVANTPMLPTKFLYLKHLKISMTSGRASPTYDYYSLVSFLGDFKLGRKMPLVSMENNKKHESVIGHSSQWRLMAKHHHCSLRSVKMTGFSSSKSLVELTCYILKNAVSLECLILDTLFGPRCSGENYDRRCFSMIKSMLIEAPRALVAIKTYIEDKVPASVKLIVVEPRSRCHAVPL